MVTTSVGYTPAVIAGMTIYPNNPLQFDFIIDTGDDNLQGEELRKESKKLINYFLATLTVPEDEMWVNLSPYEKDRIIANGLGVTEMGRDMLAQDYLLKQLTSSLMYPEEEIGEQFWKKIYEKTQARLGSTEIPTNTFNKVWIVPDKAVVFVNGTNVFVSESHLKVMLEEDYLALESNKESAKHGLGNMTEDDIQKLSEEAKNVIREVIIPEIEKEVNTGKNFANLRQIYNSMILAAWYKKNLKESMLGKVYIDSNKTTGIDLEDKNIKEKIYKQYVEAFQKGVYNYIKEDYDPTTQQVIPRKYFSGGLKGVDRATISEQGESARIPVVERFADSNPEYTTRIRLDMTGDGGKVITPLKPGNVDGAMLTETQSIVMANSFEVATSMLRGSQGGGRTFSGERALEYMLTTSLAKNQKQVVMRMDGTPMTVSEARAEIQGKIAKGERVQVADISAESFNFLYNHDIEADSGKKQNEANTKVAETRAIVMANSFEEAADILKANQMSSDERVLNMLTENLAKDSKQVVMRMDGTPMTVGEARAEILRKISKGERVQVAGIRAESFNFLYNHDIEADSGKKQNEVNVKVAETQAIVQANSFEEAVSMLRGGQGGRTFYGERALENMLTTSLAKNQKQVVMRMDGTPMTVSEARAEIQKKIEKGEYFQVADISADPFNFLYNHDIEADSGKKQIEANAKVTETQAIVMANSFEEAKLMLRGGQGGRTFYGERVLNYMLTEDMAKDQKQVVMRMDGTPMTVSEARAEIQGKIAKGERVQVADISAESFNFLYNHDADNAMLNPGGIDFNPDMLNLSEQGQAINFTIDNSILQTLQPNSVKGIQPVIINITPIINYIPLLGLGEGQEKQQISHL